MKKMKKMLVALLAMTMILSSFGAVHADAGTAVTGWSGDGVYAVNPVGTDDVLKLTNGKTAELALKSFGAGGALVTVDFYAAALQTSTIALLPNGKEETPHGSITLSADGKVNGAASYTAASWHTAQLLVLPGTDQYEVYLDGTFVAAGTAHIPGLPGVPGKLKVTAGGDLYLNNVKIEKVQKQLDTGMNAAYTSDFSGAAIGTALRGKDGWTTPAAVDNVEYTIAADPSAEEAASNVVKIERKTTSGNVRMAKTLDLTGNDVAVEAWVYQTAYEAVNEANALNIFLRNGQNRQVQLVSLLRNNVYIGMNPTYGQTGAAATFNNQYTAGQWVKVRAELVGETGSLNIYVSDTLVNTVPVGTKQLHSDSGDSMEAESAQLDFGEFAGYKELDFEVKNAPGIWYVKDIKVEQGAVSQGEVTLFDEDFEGNDADLAFTHAGGNGTDQYLNLTPMSNALSDSETSPKAGYLADHTYVSGKGTVHYLEDGSGQDTLAVNLSSKTQEYYTADFSNALSQVKNLKQLKLSFRHYSSALARKDSNAGTIRDTLQIGLNSSAQVYQAAKGGEPRLKIQSGNVYSGLVNNTVDRSNTKISGTASDRAWNTQEMIYDNTTGVVTVSTNGVARSYCVDSRGNKVADTDLSYTAGKGTELGHLNMEIETTNGGGYYLDDIKVTAVCDVAETNVKDDYTAAAFLADAIQENPFSLDSVVTDGNTVTAVKLTKQQETSGDVYLFVASYSATGMIQCAVEKVDAQLKEQQTVSLTDVIDTEEASKVKAFLFDGDLVPLARLYTVK